MATDPRDAWAVESRPVPDDLEAQAEPYEDPWNSIMQRLDPDTIKQLARYVV